MKITFEFHRFKECLPHSDRDVITLLDVKEACAGEHAPHNMFLIQWFTKHYHQWQQQPSILKTDGQLTVFGKYGWWAYSDHINIKKEDL